MKSPIVKRSIFLGGRKTSISIEDEFWSALKEIAQKSGIPVNHLVAQIDSSRQNHNLSSAVRRFVLHHYRELLSRMAPQLSDFPMFRAPLPNPSSQNTGLGARLRRPDGHE